MSEFITIEIRFNPAANGITVDELTLLESILPAIIHAMMRTEGEAD